MVAALVSLNIAIDASAVAVCCSIPSVTQNTSAGDDGRPTSRLDDAGAANQALAGRRRHPIQLVFGR